MPIHYFIRSFLRVTGGNCDEIFSEIKYYDHSVLYQIQTKESDQVKMLHRRGLLEDDVTYVPGTVAGALAGGLETARRAGKDGRPTMAERGLESARRAGVDGRPTMAERGAGTTFSNLQKRVTMMKEKGDFEGSLQKLVDWEGKGTPKQKKNAKDKKEEKLRNFRDDTTKSLEKALGDLEEYAQHATEEESEDISEWIDFVRDRKKRLEDAWKVRTDQEAEKKKKKKK
jgi:hypothetical protein